jgi:hypothetical protein
MKYKRVCIFFLVQGEEAHATMRSLLCLAMSAATIMAFSVGHSHPVRWPWFVCNMRPNDPTLTCHCHHNGTWVCAPDCLLYRGTDANDSY